MKSTLMLTALAFWAIFALSLALAHPGGIAGDGCHSDRAAGERHCHPDGDRSVTLTLDEMAAKVEADAVEAAIAAKEASMQATIDELQVKLEMMEIRAQAAECRNHRLTMQLAVAGAPFWDKSYFAERHKRDASDAGCDTRGW